MIAVSQIPAGVGEEQGADDDRERKQVHDAAEDRVSRKAHGHEQQNRNLEEDRSDDEDTPVRAGNLHDAADALVEHRSQPVSVEETDEDAHCQEESERRRARGPEIRKTRSSHRAPPGRAAMSLRGNSSSRNAGVSPSWIAYG